MISIDDFKKCEIRVGEILTVELIENSEKLLKLSVNFGEDNPRTVVSGIRKYFEDPQTLVGVRCAFATNLEPRPLMGIPSEAMILAATADDPPAGGFSLLKTDPSLPAGAKVN